MPINEYERRGGRGQVSDAAKCQKCGGSGLARAFGEAGEFGATEACPECDDHQAVGFHPGNYFGYGYGMRWS